VTYFKKYIKCPNCSEVHELTLLMQTWAGVKCFKCGEFMVLIELRTYTKQELELEAQNV